MPNAWDGRSAMILGKMGFEALGTSSEAIALSLGREDYQISREESLRAARAVVEAAPELPVSADLESGFGDTPNAVAETIKRAGQTGLAGCSIEDARAGETLYPVELAVERVAAAVAANGLLENPMVLTARVEHYLQPDPANLTDTITRLQAYAEAGADVLFAPGLPDLAAVRRVAAAVTKPLSVIGSMSEGIHSVDEFTQARVGRISTATSLYRTGPQGLECAVREILGKGTFRYVNSS
ncbi:MAG: oxaloacetate decarboxylase [Synoicihabitans sp.]